MAKKEKIALTPEERLAKLNRKRDKRKIFGETFFKACALFLAVVFVYAAAYVAFGGGRTVYQSTYTPPAAVVGGSGTVVGGGDGTAAGGEVSSEAQAAVDAINTATAAAANASYHWTRNCVVENISVGDKTQAINDIIHMVDENADLNSVVGGFLGQGSREGDYAPGKDAAEVFGNDQYALKGTSLQAADLQGLTVEGTKYTFTLPVSDNPQKDGKTPLSRLTNDFITQDEVATGVKDALGMFSSLLTVKSSDVSFDQIQVTVELNDAGQLTAMSFSYYMDVKSLALNIATGTGNGTVSVAYSNFVY